MHGGEHNLEYYNLFQDYLVIYEVIITCVLFVNNSCSQKTLTAYLDTIDCPIEDFYAEVRSTKTESTDAYMQYFIDCLLASADYDSFYKVMAKQGSLLKHSRGDSKAESKDNGKAKFASSSKAEGKSSKAGDDDEDDDKGVK
jgi:hypothetical protein